MNGFPNVDGEAPVSQRESLNDYADRVLPVVDDFQHAVSAAGAGELRVGEAGIPRFPVRPCGDDTWSITALAAVGSLVPLETLMTLGNEHFLKLGFSEPQQFDNGTGVVTVRWFDPVNGGYVSATWAEGSHTGMLSMSGCRLVTEPKALEADLAAKFPYEAGFATPEPAK
ncbi:DUF4853 domain-containing protein [Gulosibacter macacae]|nr:DUF4853 domain-containing protein [Gulosibacter macacae]